MSETGGTAMPNLRTAMVPNVMHVGIPNGMLNGQVSSNGMYTLSKMQLKDAPNVDGTYNSQNVPSGGPANSPSKSPIPIEVAQSQPAATHHSHKHDSNKPESSGNNKASGLKESKLLENFNGEAKKLIQNALVIHLRGIIQNSRDLVKRSKMYQGSTTSFDVLKEMAEEEDKSEPNSPLGKSTLRTQSAHVTGATSSIFASKIPPKAQNTRVDVTARDIFIANKDNFSQRVIYKYFTLLDDIEKPYNENDDDTTN